MQLATQQLQTNFALNCVEFLSSCFIVRLVGLYIIPMVLVRCPRFILQTETLCLPVITEPFVIAANLFTELVGKTFPTPVQVPHKR